MWHPRISSFVQPKQQILNFKKLKPANVSVLRTISELSISASWIVKVSEPGLLLRATLTWRFLRCSAGRRRRSSGWLPPSWSRPPPRSDHSLGSWRRQLRDSVRGFTVIARVWPLFIIFILEPTRSQTPFVSARSWQLDPRAAAKNERVERDNEASAPGNKTTTAELTSGWCLVGLTYRLSLCAAPPSVTVFTKMPSFSRPMSAPAPIPMMLMPKPSPSGGEMGTEDQLLLYGHCSLWWKGCRQFDLLMSL